MNRIGCSAEVVRSPVGSHAISTAKVIVVIEAIVTAAGVLIKQSTLAGKIVRRETAIMVMMIVHVGSVEISLHIYATHSAYHG